MACACTSLPVWLETTELAYFQVNLTPGSGQHLSRWLRQAGWLAAGPPIRVSLSCAGPARHVKSESVSIQQQPATFMSLTVSQFKLGQSVLPHPRLQGLIRSRPLLHRDPCWCLGRRRHGGGGGRCWPGPAPDVCHQPPGKTVIIYCHYDLLTSTLVVQW